MFFIIPKAKIKFQIKIKITDTILIYPEEKII